MFKSLKSKLEDEAKKLQASVQQYGEQISQQMRTNTSDAGSESSSNVTRRFLNAVSGSPSASKERQPQDSDTLNYSVGNALMEEVSEGDLLGLDLPPRERRLSGGSTHSNESSLSALFSYIPGTAGSVFDPAESDLDSTLDEVNSGLVRSADKEQVSSALFKLQNRASGYKDKYRDMVRRYNEVVTENNKCRTVLAQTQDKALKRIEKLREEKKSLQDKLIKAQQSGNTENEKELESKLADSNQKLEKCIAEIKRNRVKIKELQDENDAIRKITEAGGEGEDKEHSHTALATAQVEAEWKERINKVEEEWTQRINKLESDHALQLATTKAEMHAALEAKDREIESLRTKNRTLEIQDGQANERWQKKVDDLQAVVKALEAEKAEQIEKLSEAKLQGVKAIQEEAEKKREALEQEWKERVDRMKEEHAKELRQKTTEIEQLQFSHDAATRQLAELNAKLNESAEQIERLREAEQARKTTEQTQQSATEDSVQQVQAALATAEEQHRKELEELTAKLEAEIWQQREQNEFEAKVALQRIESLLAETENIRRQNFEYDDERMKAINELEKVNASKAEIEGAHNHALAHVAELSAELEKKDDAMRQMVHESEELKTQLAEARSLTELHERLQQELEDTRQQRNEIEQRVNELADAARRKEEELRKERQEFLEEKRRFEESGLLKSSNSNEKTDTDQSHSVEQVHELIEFGDLQAAPPQQLSTDDDTATPSLDELSKEIVRLNESLEAERASTAELHQRLRNMESELEDTKAIAEEAELKRTEILTKLSALEEETKAIVRDLEQENEKIREEKEHLEEELRTIKQSMESVRESANFETSESAKLREEIAINREQRHQIEKQTEELRSDKKLLEELNEVLTIDKTALEEKIDAIERQFKQAKLELDAAKLQEEEKMQSKEQELTQTRQLVEQLKTQHDELRMKIEQSGKSDTEKEELVASLREELHQLRDTSEHRIKELQDREEQTKLQLKQAASELEKSAAEISRLQTEFEKAKETLNTVEEKNRKERDEDKIVREQYLQALETVKEELLEANTREKEFRKQEEQRKTIHKKLEELEREITRKDAEMEEAKRSQEKFTESAVADIKQKAEKKLAKLKGEMDKNILEAQNVQKNSEAETEKLRLTLSEVEKKVDNLVVEKAKLEQQLILKEANEKEIEESKHREEKISAKVNELEKKVWSLEEEVARLEEEKAEAEEAKEQFKSDVEKKNEEIEGMNEKIKTLSESNEEGFRRAAAKQDSESKKVLRELQREVKQLYVELNEKSEALDATRKALEASGLETKHIVHGAQSAAERKNKLDSMDDIGKGPVDQSEELESMRKRLAACHRDLDELREEKAKLEKKLEAAVRGQKMSSQPATLPVNGESSSGGGGNSSSSAATMRHEHSYEDQHAFASPAEAEYLKNVLYQYMINRETLGHEALTLARVIGTVAKFDKKELDAVLQKEETRLAGWVGSLNSTVSHLAANAANTTTRR